MGEGLPLDPSSPQASPFSFHPALARLHARYLEQNSRLAVVASAGYDPANRSHFASQDILETGGVNQAVFTGWINRVLEVLPASQGALVRAMAFRSTVPLSMRGPEPGAFGVPSTSSVIVPTLVPPVLQPLLARNEATTQAAAGMYGSMGDALSVVDLFSQLDPTLFPPQNGAEYPNNGFAQALREVAVLMRADIGVDVFQVELGGWDHHSQIAPRLGDRAAILDGGLGEFMTDLGSEMDDVVVLTLTDFGREIPQNGSEGTDHGVAQAMFVAGGMVRGGDPGGGAQVHSWSGLSNLDSGRFLRVAVDFRDVIGEVLVRHLGLSAGDLAQVFPGLVHAPIGLLSLIHI